MKKVCNLFLGGLLCSGAFAQLPGFHFSASLDTPRQTGFYLIEITPQISSLIQPDFRDIRIINKSGRAIPYIISNQSFQNNRTGIVDRNFSVLESSAANTSSIVVFSADSGLSTFKLHVRNTFAERTFKISGSDDRKQWFVIIDSIRSRPLINTENNNAVIKINMPAAGYSFYRVFVNNNGNDPLNILSVSGDLKTRPDAQNEIENPLPTTLQTDSAGYSLIKITQGAPYHFSRIKLELAAPMVFYRRAEILSADKQVIQSFILADRFSTETQLPRRNDKIFYLRIRNGDNPALPVKSVHTFVTASRLIAMFQNNEAYSLEMGNPAAEAPQYDLAEAKPSLATDSFALLKTGNIITMQVADDLVTHERRQSWLLWLILAASAMILLLFSFKMLKEIKMKDADL